MEEVVVEEELLCLVTTAAEPAPKVAALFEVVEKQELLDLAPLVEAEVVTSKAPFQTRLSAELVERLPDVLVDVVYSAMRNFSKMNRALAVPLQHVASPGAMKPVFQPVEFQIGALVLEETSGRRASERTGMVEKAVLEVRLGLAASAAAAMATLAALVETPQNLDYRRAQMVDLDPVEEAVVEKMGHCQDCSHSRGRDLSPVLTMDLMVPLAGRRVKTLTTSPTVVWKAAVV